MYFQPLGLTTLELTSLSFIFCTVQTLFPWSHRPLDAEETIEFQGPTPGDLIYAFVYISTYLDIHLTAWKFLFPIETERLLWRVASFVLLALSTFYFTAFAFGEMGGVALYGKYVLHNSEVGTTVELASIMTPGIALAQRLRMIVLYFLARSYIIAEGFVALRMLPASTYLAVAWSAFVPHFG
ncbi:hypothetical protein B0J12DRAFT_789519 [Macrophomina phaseolina]|uniref:Uncharacterized protein n=1 Tax=Macrophomina phaseolina TaxID=35725 RepID=A0ABQ8FW67_9PEZI|nr:hypothetical protein B0J12DRAFT_789519 [Macrophomina phaseolina]